jgi:2-oxoglutarate ferredoxin oxidoreductase subunit gamma
MKKDPEQDNNGFYNTLIIAGFGGQGVLVIGNLLAYAAMREGKHISFLPFYGVEMRGGTADCTLVISSQGIGSPVVDRAQSVIAMNQASLVKFEQRLQARGLLMINSSLIDPKEATRQDVQLLSVPANDIAKDSGNAKLANMVALGAFIEKTKLVQMTSLFQSFEKILDQRYHPLIPSNMKAIQKGAAFVRSLP